MIRLKKRFKARAEELNNTIKIIEKVESLALQLSLQEDQTMRRRIRIKIMILTKHIKELI